LAFRLGALRRVAFLAAFFLAFFFAAMLFFLV